jgi:multiple sugar transport system substrate-binding protein
MSEKLSRRKFLRVAAVGAGALLVASCQPKVVEVEKIVKETVIVKGPAEQVVLTHTFWGDPGEWKLWVEFDDRFSAENPGVSMISEHIPTAYEDQIMLRRASGDMPDVLNIQDEPFPKYADKGVYTDLTALVERDSAELDLDDFFPQLLEMFQWDPNAKSWLSGNQYAMPWDGAGILWYYNMDTFEKVGVEPPPNSGWDWTMDDFLELCLKITEFDDAGNMVRGAFALPGWVYHMPFIMTMGGQYVDLEKGKCMLNTPESIEAVQYYVDLRLKHRVCPLATEFAGMGGVDLFREGKLAMNLTGPWWYPELRAIPWEDMRWDNLHFPKNPTTGERYVRQSWDGMAIGEGTEHVEEAWEYIKFIISPEGQARIAQLGRAMPARPSVAKSEAFLDPDQPPPHEEVFLDAVEYYHVQPINLYWSELWTIIGKYWEMMTLDDVRMPVAEALEKVCIGVDYLFEHGEMPETY